MSRHRVLPDFSVPAYTDGTLHHQLESRPRNLSLHLLITSTTASVSVLLSVVLVFLSFTIHPPGHHHHHLGPFHLQVVITGNRNVTGYWLWRAVQHYMVSDDGDRDVILIIYIDRGDNYQRNALYKYNVFE